MNSADRGKLVGMALGDGYIRTASAADKKAGRRIAPQFYMGHCLKQADYLTHKVDVLNKMFGGKATVRYRRQAKPPTCYANKSNPYFRTLKRMMYEDGKKRITPRVLSMLTPAGIAYWFMDDGSYRFNRRHDGSISSVSLTISTYVSHEENNHVIEYFKAEHGVQFKPAYCKKTRLWYIRCNTANARKMATLIEPHVIPSMAYKLSAVEALDCHECPAPDKTCKSCGRIFAALRARGLCMDCYQKEWVAKQSQYLRTCTKCQMTINGKWFVGDTCRSCYNKRRRAMR